MSEPCSSPTSEHKRGRNYVTLNSRAKQNQIVDFIIVRYLDSIIVREKWGQVLRYFRLKNLKDKHLEKEGKEEEILK